MASTKAAGALASINAVLPRGGELPEQVWQARHRGICLLLWAHVVGLALVAIWQGAPRGDIWLQSVSIASFSLAAMWGSRGRGFRSSMAVLGLLSSSAVLIDTFDGLIEAHFHFFVTIVVVSLYQAWLPYLLAVSYVLLHHVVLGTLIPGDVYNHHQAIEQPWLFAAVHASAVLAESVACLVFWRATENAIDAERVIGDELAASNAELTRANLAVSDLVAMLSHDLRVPLSVLIGYSEMALESWPEMGDEAKADYLRRVSKAAKTMHALLDDTLTVTALDSDGVEPRSVPVRIDKAVREMVGSLPHEDRVDLTGLAPSRAVVDRGHLDQVLTNLLTNAHKYGGDVVTVTTDEVLDEVVLRVSDSGAGVPTSFVPQLFHRFTRSESARAGAQKGTDLGLYITRTLLVANGGEIHYEPAIGGGSTFGVVLPRYRRPSDPMIPPRELDRLHPAAPRTGSQ